MDELYGRIPKFKNFDLLKKHIDYYLNDEITRANIAYANRKFVSNFFTFKHQVENIIKIAK
jgi:spore maturation protein CgeB